MLENLYLVPFLLGRNPQSLDVWHGSNLEWIEYAVEIPHELVSLWDAAALHWAEEVSDNPAVVDKVARYVAIHQALKSEPRGRRTAVSGKEGIERKEGVQSLGSRADSWLDRPAGGGLLDSMVDPDPFPAWMTTDDLDYFVAAFEAGGFRGPVNRYRNQARDFETLPGMGAYPVQQPSCFIAGEKDVVRCFIPGRDAYSHIDQNCTDFRFSRLIPGAGHWVQQEAPEAVNDALLEFFAGLKG